MHVLRRLLIAALVSLLAPAAAHAATVVPGWSYTPAMNTPRYEGAATLLTDGRVLVVGGVNAATNEGLASAEVFDPRTERWTRVASMIAARRRGHTATLLGNGMVLVAGGAHPQTGLAEKKAELYDPARDRWTPLPDMNSHHMSQGKATLLEDGRVLIASRTWEEYRWEIFNPAAVLPPAEQPPLVTWWRDSEFPAPAAEAVVRLPEPGPDRVLAIGREGAGLFNPVSNRFEFPDALKAAPRREGIAVALLADGRVLVIGGPAGMNGEETEKTNLYTPALGTWSETAGLATGRGYHTATRLPNGKVMVTGGETGGEIGPNEVLSSVELYDPATHRWSAAPSMLERRTRHTATPLRNGKILILGGGPMSAELWTPATSLLTTRRLDLGDVTIGAAAKRASVEIANTGDAPMLVTRVQLKGSTGGFTMGTDQCSAAPVAPGSSCRIELRFVAARDGAQSASLAFHANTSPTAHVVDVTARGVPAPLPTIAPPEPPAPGCTNAGRADGRSVGVSIEKAAKYTNRARVELSVTAPDGAAAVTVSNDGGFAGPFSGPVQPHAPYAWTLASSGPERLPKTVYVRFAGPCIDPSQTYQDDIILDQTAPELRRARLAAPRGPAKGARRVVTVHARDNASGVSVAEFRRKRREAAVFTVRYKRRITLPAARGNVIAVRVRDGAGNTSRWKRLGRGR